MSFYSLRDWLLITSFSHAEGGGTSFGVVFMQYLKDLAILKGGAKSFHSLKGWAQITVS